MDDRRNGFWSQLSETEKNNLYEMIGFVEKEETELDKPKHYIGKKKKIEINK